MFFEESLSFEIQTEIVINEMISGISIKITIGGGRMLDWPELIIVHSGSHEYMGFIIFQTYIPKIKRSIFNVKKTNLFSLLTI